MWRFSLQLSFFLLASVGHIQSQSACSTGWFGQNCEYKCHCTNNSCDIQTGACTGQDSTCDNGWFGPACQYLDLTPLGNVTAMDQSLSVISQVSDADDKTCYTNGSLHSIVVTWNVTHYFTWMRVIVEDEVMANKFRASFKNSSDTENITCDNAKQWMVNSRTVDIHCDQNGTSDQVILTWSGEISLCSVHISGGRNIALKQNATQTSTGRRDGVLTTAEKAVDGVTERSPDHCSATKLAIRSPLADPKATWSLTLSRPHLVYRILIYNTFYKIDLLLQGFTLTSFTQDHMTVFTYKDQEDSVLDVYSVIHGPKEQPVTHVEISAEQHEKRKAATFCEVEIYGDSECPAGWYGRDCQLRCHCAVDGEPCFVSTGACPSGCAAGFYGEGCQGTSPSDPTSEVVTGVGVGLGLLVIIIIIVIVIIYRTQKQSTEATPQSHHPGYEDISPGQRDFHQYQVLYRGADGYDLSTDSTSVPPSSNNPQDGKYENTVCHDLNVEADTNLYEITLDDLPANIMSDNRDPCETGKDNPAYEYVNAI